jgi:hypothetical protein
MTDNYHQHLKNTLVVEAVIPNVIPIANVIAKPIAKITERLIGYIIYTILSLIDNKM